MAYLPGYRSYKAFALGLVLTVLALFQTSSAHAQDALAEPMTAEATITTDQFDYPPNTVVTFAGTGWAPAETVQIQISQSDGDPDTLLSAIADEWGTIRNSDFSTGPNDLGTSFTVVAIGQTSEFVAVTSFIDSDGITLSPSSFLQTNAGVPLDISVALSGSCGFSCSFSTSDHHVFISGPALPTTELFLSSVGSNLLGVIVPAAIANVPGTYQVVVRKDISSTTFFSFPHQHCSFFGGCFTHIHSGSSTSSQNDHFSSPAQLTISSLNQAPSVDAGGPYNVGEGGSVLVTATGSDPDGNPLSYAWDLDNNGTFETLGQAVSFSAATIDGLASRTINARASDGSLVDTDSATVNIANVAPTPDAGGPYNVNEGGSVGLSGSATDPAAADVLSYAWDLDNNGTFETAGQNPTFSAVGLDGPAAPAVVLRVCDDDGDCNTDQATVIIGNVAPIVMLDAGNDLSVSESGTTEHIYDYSIVSNDPITSVATSCGANGTKVVGSDANSNTSGSFKCVFPDGPATSIVGASATDSDTDTGAAATQTVTVANVAPIVTLSAGNDVNVNENGTTEHTYNYSISDPGNDTATGVTTSCGANGTKVVGSDANSNTSGSFKCVFPDGPATSIVSASATDSDTDTGAAATQTVTVANVAPTLGAITAPIDPVQVGVAANAGAPFTDPGTDTHTCSIDWGDSSGIVTESSGSGTCSRSHPYVAAGVYTVEVTVTDDDGESDSSLFQYVVVYDPGAGFVTGGGWINSPHGAYTPGDATDPDVTGKATFGFVSKYKRGATVPDGNTEFQFHAGNLNFKSTSYEWLVISGPKAQYKGWGTINGAGAYRFILTANDGQVNGGGGVDRFRIKIWDSVTETIIYDNQAGLDDLADATDAIENGSIVIHRK